MYARMIHSTEIYMPWSFNIISVGLGLVSCGKHILGMEIMHFLCWYRCILKVLLLIVQQLYVDQLWHICKLNQCFMDHPIVWYI